MSTTVNIIGGIVNGLVGGGLVLAVLGVYRIGRNAVRAIAGRVVRLDPEDPATVKSLGENSGGNVAPIQKYDRFPESQKVWSTKKDTEGVELEDTF